MVETGSQLLDVVIALAFVFFLLSLICSGISELIAAALQLRADSLEKALRKMLADDSGGPADEVIDHPLISRLTKGKKKTPSYISSRSFSLALLDVFTPREDRPEGMETVAAVKAKLAELPAPLRRQLEPILDEAEGEIDKLRTGIEEWFDDAMDRVSGWYKRKSQWIIAIVAIVVTVGLNVSTVRVVDRLWNDGVVRDAVASAAAAAVAEQSDQTPEPAGGAAEAQAPAPEADPLEELQANGQEVKDAVSDLAALNLPIGWGEDNRDWLSVLNIGGWLLTIVAVTLGAPFWFDALSRLAPLRSTGPPPKKDRSPST
jgi:uncharacterized protein involved in cysteine biosynthesis